MSQDLLAAFGDPPAQPTKSGSSTAPAQSFSFFDDFNSTKAPATGQSKASKTFDAFGDLGQAPVQTQKSRYQDNAPGTQDDDDDWGDFEGSTDVIAKPAPPLAPASAAKPAPIPVATQFSRWLDEEDDGFPDYAHKTTAPKTNAKWDFTKPEAPLPQARDPNVLFDAEDEPPVEDDDDDFGDFEAAEQSVKPVPAMGGSGMNDLLGMDNFTQQQLPPASKQPQVQQFTASTKTASKPTTSSSLLDLEDLTLESDSTNAWTTEESKPAPIHGFGTLGALSKPKSPTNPPASPPKKAVRKKTDTKPVKQPPAPRQRNVLRKAPPPQAVATEDNEQWDDFEAWTQETSIPATAPEPRPPVRSTQQHNLAIPSSLTSSSADSSLNSPPTNIPPPALVLSLFSTLFSSSETSFFKPLRQESSAVQQAVYLDPGAITYLGGLIALATVCGRVIAGRKHRWKRDTILAQSMRIGPSASGGVSGLKLTSIDKAEVAKEDREAADALRAWQGIVGKLKSAIAEVKRITGGDVGKIPDLKETLAVKVAKEIEGGLKGNRPCALCGLKREERVLKVDFEVEDSFGEWWVENVSMHRDCRNFWEQHRDSLRSR